VQKNTSTLIIACGALARELTWAIDANNWENIFEVTCLPANLHNRPEKIPEEMRKKIHQNRDKYKQIIALYGDCGTGGKLDRILKEENVKRIPGAHCYEFLSGSSLFSSIAEQEIGTFYLTDYLVRFFDRLIIEGLGIKKHPELLPVYFGNYTRLVYLAQSEDKALQEKARQAANKLGLTFEYKFTGFQTLSTFIGRNT